MEPEKPKPQLSAQERLALPKTFQAIGAVIFGRYLRLQCRFTSRGAAQSVPTANPTGRCVLCRQYTRRSGGALVSVLAHFFEGGRWGAFVQSTVEGQRLSEEDQLFPFWLPGAHIFRGWARSILGMPAEGLVWIEDGIREYRASGATLNMPYWLALKAEALQLVGRVVEALDTIKKAEARTCGH